MVPSAYQPFFAASLGAAAALLGLLFVAVSIAPERTVAQGAPVQRQTVADSVFTALLNAFFFSLGGAVPGFDVGSMAVTLSIVALLQTLYAGWRLWPRPVTIQTFVRRLGLVLVGLFIYGLQLYYALDLLRAPQQLPAFSGLINLLFATYGFAILRSWELLGARRSLPSGWLSPLHEDEGQQHATAPGRPEAPVRHATPDGKRSPKPPIAKKS